MMTEDLEPRMRDIPDVSNFPRNEVIIQKSHRYAFDHQIRQTGAKLIEVETREEMIAAINPKYRCGFSMQTDKSGDGVKGWLSPIGAVSSRRTGLQ
jgi:hypothetical protein